MAKRGGNIVLNSYDDLFETQQSKDDAEKEKVDSLSKKIHLNMIGIFYYLSLGKVKDKTI